MALKVGDKVPPIRAKDQNGEAFHWGDYIGKRVILYFYPKDSTPGCTAQACNLRDNYETLLSKNIAVIGVSPDGEQSHHRFIQKHALPFPLIVDTEKIVCQDYGVWGLKKFMGKEYMGVHRTTFVIDAQGYIMHIIDKVKTKQATAQVLEFIER